MQSLFSVPLEDCTGDIDSFTAEFPLNLGRYNRPGLVYAQFFAFVLVNSRSTNSRAFSGQTIGRLAELNVCQGLIGTEDGRTRCVDFLLNGKGQTGWPRHVYICETVVVGNKMDVGDEGYVRCVRLLRRMVGAKGRRLNRDIDGFGGCVANGPDLGRRLGQRLRQRMGVSMSVGLGRRVGGSGRSGDTAERRAAEGGHGRRGQALRSIDGGRSRALGLGERGFGRHDSSMGCVDGNHSARGILAVMARRVAARHRARR